MPQVGPTLPDELATCRRQKLAQLDFWIDKVTVFKSALGIDAMEFHVGDFDKTYGTPQPGATTKIYYFTSENRLVSLAASESFTGLNSVTLGSLNKECVVLDKKQ